MPSKKAQHTLAVFLYTASILTSAFLLFYLQPLIAKMLLPYLGGSPAVWNICMVFFQALLLAGYACAHLLAARLSPRHALQAYLGILAVAALALVLGLSGASIAREAPTGAPIPWLLLTLLTSIGLPFMSSSIRLPWKACSSGKNGFVPGTRSDLPASEAPPALVP